MLGDHALRPDRPTPSAGGTKGRAQACGPLGAALFRLTPLRRAVAQPVTSREAGPARLPGAGGAIGAGLAWEP